MIIGKKNNSFSKYVENSNSFYENLLEIVLLRSNQLHNRMSNKIGKAGLGFTRIWHHVDLSEDRSKVLNTNSFLLSTVHLTFLSFS